MPKMLFLYKDHPAPRDLGNDEKNAVPPREKELPINWELAELPEGKARKENNFSETR